MISDRALGALADPSPLVVNHFEAAKDVFHAVDNPEGIINLGTAENYLMSKEALAWINKKLQLTPNDLHYAEFRGIASVREALAGFLTRVSGIEGARPENVVVGNGVSSLLESLAFSLFDAGDSIIIPAPYYTGYEEDFCHRFGVKIIPAQMSVTTGFELDVEVIARAYKQAQESGERVKAILINNPNNPLGKLYTRQQLLSVIEFAKQYQLQIIADEIYAHSVHDLNVDKHESLLSIGKDYKHSIHVLYGLAKDFGLSGFKFAMCYSENDDVLKALSANAYFYNVSTLMQCVIAQIFSHTKQIEAFLHEYRQRLSTSYEFVRQVNAATLKAPICSAQAGHFIFLDLGAYLKKSDKSSEMELYDCFWRQSKVNITPGQFFHCDQPGWFRMCFANEEATVKQAFVRLHRDLNNHS